MTENPTVPPPPGLQQQFPSNSTSIPTPDEAGDASGEIQCICDYTEDDGYTICCDGCGTWQHIACMQLREDDLPKKYLCSNCLPRLVDAKKARDLQRQRRRDEKSNRRKRAAITSKQRKETNAAQNGIVGIVTTHEKPSVVKLPSPREPQAPPARKRNRVSHSAPGNATCVGAAGIASPLPPTDRNGDAESDTDLEKYKIEFLDMGNDPNKYIDDDVRNFLSKTATKNDNVFKRYSQQEFTSISFPKASVRMLPDSSKSYSEHSRWCYVLEAATARSKPVALFKGEVGFQDRYKLEPINQYGIWHHPKPYVVFHPDLPIYIDARQWATEARFVRRSCKPNVCVKTLVVDHSVVYFGLVTSEPIKAGTELTIGWDWNGSVQLQNLENVDNLSKLSADEIKLAALWVENLLDKMGECACSGGVDCLLAKIRKLGGIEPAVVKRPTANGNGRKRAKRNPSAELSASKEATPDRGATGNDEEEDAKQFTKAKSRSRDLTPALPHEIAVDSGAMTSREARKFKDVLSRIEKQSQEPTPNKRQKRSSNASLPPRGNSPGSDVTRRGEEARKPKPRKLESPATSPGSASVREVSVVDASTGRSPSSSSGPLEHGQSRLSSNSPVVSSTSNQARRKMKPTKSSKIYVDSSMQTDPIDNELPWWTEAAHQVHHSSPRTPLRKRLVQGLVRDREEAIAASAGQDKKRKHDTFAEDTSVSLQPPKQPKTDESQKAPEVLVNNRAISPLPPSGESVPDSGSVLSDTEKPRTDAEIMKPPPQLPSHNIEKSPPMNGYRTSGLHLQLPPSNLPPNGVIAPGQSTPITAPINMPLAGAGILSPGILATVNASNSPVSPGQTKTKKLSLQDYRKRSHKSVDIGQPEKKETEGTVSKSASDAATAKQLAFLNVLTPNENATSATSPQAAVDSKVPAASPWGLR